MNHDESEDRGEPGEPETPRMRARLGRVTGIAGLPVNRGDFLVRLVLIAGSPPGKRGPCLRQVAGRGGCLAWLGACLVLRWRVRLANFAAVLLVGLPQTGGGVGHGGGLADPVALPGQTAVDSSGEIRICPAHAEPCSRLDQWGHLRSCPAHDSTVRSSSLASTDRDRGYRVTPGFRTYARRASALARAINVGTLGNPVTAPPCHRSSSQPFGTT